MKYDAELITLPTTGVPVPIPGLGIIVFLLRNQPTSGQHSSNSPTIASNQEIAQMIVRCRSSRKNPAISAVFGEPDFLPFPFLQLGLTRGAAVCRLVRKFSKRESSENYITLLRKAEEYRKEKFKDIEIAEILAIDKDLATTFIEAYKSGDKERMTEELEKLECVPLATGFLVGRNYLLTNYHVILESARTLDNEWLGEYIAQFGYEQDILGRKIEPVSYCFDKILGFDEKLDYALVRIEKHPIDINSSEHLGSAGDSFGWLPMLEDALVIAPPLTDEISDDELQTALNDSGISIELNVLKERAKFGEPVNIIQHPKGRRKEIVLSNNRVQTIFHEFLLYEADADFSSSGSPVLNQQWQLVGLHQAAVAEQYEDNGSTNYRIVGQKGARICRIVENLRDKANQLNQKAKDEAIANGTYNPVGQKEPPKDEDAEEILRFISDFVVEQNAPAKEKPPYAQY